MILLSDKDIKQIYSLNDCLSAVEEAFRFFSAGKVTVPVRTQINKKSNSGTFLCMPAFCDAYNASCVKVLNMFPENLKVGLSSINAKILNFDTNTGAINAILDGNYITKLRTAAATAIAISKFAKPKCNSALLIGAGGQSYSQLNAIMLARNLQKIQIADLDYERAKALADKAKSENKSSKAEISVADDVNQAVSSADIIVTDTTSTTPVYDGKRVHPGTTICAVGSYKPTMQETPSKVVAQADKIYFDSQDAVLSESGDILTPLKKNLVSRNNFTGDIGDVLNGVLPGRENNSQVILFKTVGIAAQDLFTSKSIYDKAKRLNIDITTN